MVYIIFYDRIQAPIAVGITALSSEDMYMSGGRGKCVEIFHVIGDSLCQLLEKPLMRPELESPMEPSNKNSVTEEQNKVTLDEKIPDAITESGKLFDGDVSVKRLSSNVDNLEIQDTYSEEVENSVKVKHLQLLNKNILNIYFIAF